MVNGVTFFVPGEPISKGSTRAFVNPKTGCPIVTATTGLRGRQWGNRVAMAAHDTWSGPVLGRAVPVDIAIDFTLPRPVSLPKRGAEHTKQPDLDKLVRAVLDGLEGVVFESDSQVNRLAATKSYALLGAPVGALVRIMA